MTLSVPDRSKKLLIPILILFFGVDAYSQSTDWDEYNKYWYYRYQLVNEFLVRGEENPLDPSAPGAYSIPAEGAFFRGVDLWWVDGTMHLGWYISVLATEYKLLSMNHQPTEHTKRELYFAMKAYERLDRKAERLFYPQNPGADGSDAYLNGLFVRDDISGNSFANHPEFRAKYESDDDNVFNVSSDYTRTNQGVDKDNVYPSQDQIAYLFMGFALVKKCLGNETYQGYNFSEQAVNYTKKIVSRLISFHPVHPWNGYLENLEDYPNSTTFLVERTAYGIAKAAESITGVNYASSLDGGIGEITDQGPLWRINGDPTGAGLAKFQLTNNEWKQDFTNALIMALAAVGSSWEYGLLPVRREITVPILWACHWGPVLYPCVKNVKITCYQYQLSIPGLVFSPPTFECLPELPEFTIPVTNYALSLYGSNFNQEFFALLHEYLHNKTNLIGTGTYAAILNSAPCEGPLHEPHNNPSAVGPLGWRGSNRWVRPLMADGYNEYEEEKGDPYVKGKFNGLDYMLAYNLYRLTRGPSDVAYKNMLNTVSANTITTSGKYWSYESLELSGVIQSNASTQSNPVEITANKSIFLKPGFQSQPGANVRIYIGDYTACNTTEEESGNLRERSMIFADDNISQEQVMEDITAQLQIKLDSVAAVYSTPGYTPLNEYLANNQNNNYATPAARTTATAATKNNGDEQKSNRIAMYPNPTQDKFSITLYMNNSEPVQITIRDSYNSHKTSLYEGTLKAGLNNLIFDTNDLSAGIFIIEIKGKDLNEVKRLIKLDQ